MTISPLYRLLAGGALACLTAHSAAANDTTANIAAGGLVFEKTGAIEMRSEDLTVSTESIEVRYTFVNATQADVTSTVAFPMPDVTFQPFENVHIPSDDPANPFAFATTVDGTPVAMQMEQTVLANGKDVTETLARLKIPRAQAAGALAMDALPEADKTALVDAGIAVPNEYDDGAGMKLHLEAAWTLRTAYHWQQTFPAGQTVKIEHHYKPSVGGAVGTVLGGTYGDADELAAKRKLYCVDDDLMNTVVKKTKKAGDAGYAYSETIVDYILVTGANWAKPIGDFHLVIDKGEPQNLVSFCGDGVKKISPTRFEIRKKDFLPKQDLHVLILNPAT